MIAKTLPTTLQGFFDNAWTHAVVEKHPRCVKGSACMYRCYDPSGDHSKDNACLIGCSIPEDVYKPGIENRTVTTALDMIDYPPEEDAPFGNALTDLQQVHDKTSDSDYLSTVEPKLRNFAAIHSLTIPGDTL